MCWDVYTRSSSVNKPSALREKAGVSITVNISYEYGIAVH
jgi:hypothetical protein